jgi:hypothetical protein
MFGHDEEMVYSGMVICVGLMRGASKTTLVAGWDEIFT